MVSIEVTVVLLVAVTLVVAVVVVMTVAVAVAVAVVLLSVAVAVLLLADETFARTIGRTDLDARALFTTNDGGAFLFSNWVTAAAVFAEAVFSRSFCFIWTASSPCSNFSTYVARGDETVVATWTFLGEAM